MCVNTNLKKTAHRSGACAKTIGKHYVNCAVQRKLTFYKHTTIQITHHTRTTKHREMCECVNEPQFDVHIFTYTHKCIEHIYAAHHRAVRLAPKCSNQNTTDIIFSIGLLTRDQHAYIYAHTYIYMQLTSATSGRVPTKHIYSTYQHPSIQQHSMCICMHVRQTA